ncbi:HNH endonuclease [Methylocaldum sp. 14B]|uniref:HNH endonuclease n=1 Tax=Methylocaldum sp. 14B TaxID=1912213 RepID=UPI00143A66E2|nr:HNH endonuclease [Methylocaldum sp. 14B]
MNLGFDFIFEIDFLVGCLKGATVPLSATEKRIRELLIRVARGESVARRTGRISYKEVWEHIHPDIKWGQGHTWDVVEWITHISAVELQNGRPPLNEIVTPTNKLVPKDPWGNAVQGIKGHLKKLSGISAPYKDHEEAQKACWRYWANHSDGGPSSDEIALNETEVEEGYRQDRQSSFIKRNRKIIDAAKKRDRFRCQACGFFLEVDGRPLIDCHHKIPLRHSSGVRVTKVSDLVCLCPTCHRIAHSRAYPLSVKEIRRCRGL